MCLAAILILSDDKIEAATLQPIQVAVPEQSWIEDMQEIASQFQKGATTAETDKSITDLIERLKQTQTDREIEVAAVVKNVKWRNGVATISTMREQIEKPADPLSKPLRVYQTYEFEIKASQDEAIAIKPDMPLTFRGRLIFHPSRWGAVGRSTKSQQICTLKHEALTNHHLETFTAKQYEIKIDGRLYPGLWSAK
jgi:hypothetical protein